MKKRLRTVSICLSDMRRTGTWFHHRISKISSPIWLSRDGRYGGLLWLFSPLKIESISVHIVLRGGTEHTHRYTCTQKHRQSTHSGDADSLCLPLSFYPSSSFPFSPWADADCLWQIALGYCHFISMMYCWWQAWARWAGGLSFTSKNTAPSSGRILPAEGGQVSSLSCTLIQWRYACWEGSQLRLSLTLSTENVLSVTSKTGL